jgi:hypothetical protein
MERFFMFAAPIAITGQKLCHTGVALLAAVLICGQAAATTLDLGMSQAPTLVNQALLAQNSLIKTGINASVCNFDRCDLRSALVSARLNGFPDPIGRVASELSPDDNMLDLLRIAFYNTTRSGVAAIVKAAGGVSVSATGIAFMIEGQVFGGPDSSTPSQEYTLAAAPVANAARFGLPSINISGLFSNRDVSENPVTPPVEPPVSPVPLPAGGLLLGGALIGAFGGLTARRRNPRAKLAL